MKREILPDYSDIISASDFDTLKIADAFAACLSSEDYVYLKGELGAGKTVFAKGIINHFIQDNSLVNSPSYGIVKEYHSDKITIYHFDLYRITSKEELISTGYFDYNNGLIISEWCENIPFSLPDIYYEVDIERVFSNNSDLFSEPNRKITIYKVNNE